MAEEARSGQLNSWKEIAGYLGRDMRTIQRWEKDEGLPIHRHLHSKRSSVYAFRSELDSWWYGRRAELEPAEKASLLAGAESRRRIQLKPFGAGLAIVLALGVGAAFYYTGSREHRGLPSAAVPLTSYPGQELSPSFSPNGQHVAFSWNGEDRHNFDIHVKQIGSYTPHRISNDPRNEYSPAWSPDGLSIAFLRDLDGGRTAIVLVPFWGGAETRLTETFSAPRPFRNGLGLPQKSLAWSPDGQWLLISDQRAPNEPFGILAVSAKTGERRQLTSPASPIMGDFSAVFSPDGTTIAFCRSTVLLMSEIYVLSLSAKLEPQGEPRKLTSDHRWSIDPAWTSAGDEVVYSSGDQNTQQLFRLKVTGSSIPQRLTSFGENGSAPALDPRGHRLVYVRPTLDCDIYSIPITQDGSGPTRQTRVVSSTSAEGNMDYSPEGSRIAFFSDRSGSDEIWISQSDGSGAAQFTSFGERRAGTPRWSPDGKQIVFDSRSDGSGDIWAMDVAGQPLPRRLTTHPASDLVPSWSRNGQWIYFASNRTGQFEVWKMPSRGGPPVQVTHQGGAYAAESADGHTVYYAKSLFSAGPGIWKVPAVGGDETKVLDSVNSWVNFIVTGKGIYFMPDAKATGIPPTIQFEAFAGHGRQLIARLEKPVCLGLALAPDGKSLLYSQVEQEGSNLMIVENFR